MDIDHNKLRKLQLRELDILKDVIKIMDDIGVKYYLSAGTLLGAVRHQGFIPWDDDIDIMLTRNDFEKFKKIMHQYIPDYYQILYYSEGYKKGSDLYRQVINAVIVIQIMDKRYNVKRSYWNQDYNQKIWIDIAVLDDVPDGKLHERWYKFRLKFLHTVLKVYRLEMKDKSWVSKSRLANIALAVNDKLHFARLIDPIKVIREIDIFLKENDGKGYHRYINFAGEYKFREIVPKSFLGKDTYLMFEGIPMRVPEHYDIYLRAIYGDDYMYPLPKNERISKHIIDVD